MIFFVWKFFEQNKNLSLINGDIRNFENLRKIINNKFDCIIHLACISNDPSFDLDPQLGKSINFDPFEELVKISKDVGVAKFIYASSSSVYGIKSESDDENFSLEPLQIILNIKQCARKYCLNIIIKILLVV